MAPRFMDALGASSSSDDDDDDAPTEAPRARATRRAITMDALARHGFRGATPPKTRANDATATDWSRGRRGDGAATYAREESARTRRAAGEGLAATCARAIERARAGEEARDEARREREERARGAARAKRRGETRDSRGRRAEAGESARGDGRGAGGASREDRRRRGRDGDGDGGGGGGGGKATRRERRVRFRGRIGERMDVGDVEMIADEREIIV